MEYIIETNETHECDIKCMAGNTCTWMFLKDTRKNNFKQPTFVKPLFFLVIEIIVG